MLLGVRIKALRKERGMTQQEFADKINVTKSTISYYENNIRIPTISNLEAIANVLNVSFDYLVGNDTYAVADTNDTEKYGMHMSKEEIDFIKEIRRYSNIHNMIIDNPKRCAELINKKI